MTLPLRNKLEPCVRTSTLWRFFGTGHATRSRRWGSRVDQALGQQAAAQGTEVKVAPKIAEPLDDAIKRRSRLKSHQAADPARDADVTWRKHVETPQTAQ